MVVVVVMLMVVVVPTTSARLGNKELKSYLLFFKLYLHPLYVINTF